MKKIILFIFILLLLFSCKKNDFYIDTTNIVNENKKIHNQLVKKKREEFYLMKENFNDYKKINIGKYSDNMITIFIYDLEICIPYNWTWITPIWINIDINDNDDFNDYASLEILNKENKVNNIYIDIYSNIIENNSLWIIYWIDNNKVFFKNINQNYNYDSSVLIDNWKEIIKVKFNIKDPIHRQIIKSIQVLE